MICLPAVVRPILVFVLVGLVGGCDGPSPERVAQAQRDEHAPEESDTFTACFARALEDGTLPPACTRGGETEVALLTEVAEARRRGDVTPETLTALIREGYVGQLHQRLYVGERDGYRGTAFGLCIEIGEPYAGVPAAPPPLEGPPPPLPDGCRWVFSADLDRVLRNLIPVMPVSLLHRWAVVDLELEGHLPPELDGDALAADPHGPAVAWNVLDEAGREAAIELSVWRHGALPTGWLRAVLGADPTVDEVNGLALELVLEAELGGGWVSSASFSRAVRDGVDFAIECRVGGDCVCPSRDLLCRLGDAIVLDLAIRLEALVWAARGHDASGVSLAGDERLAAALLVLSPSLGWAHASCREGISGSCALDFAGVLLDAWPLAMAAVRGGRGLGRALTLRQRTGLSLRAFDLDLPVTPRVRAAPGLRPMSDGLRATLQRAVSAFTPDDFGRFARLLMAQTDADRVVIRRFYFIDDAVRPAVAQGWELSDDLLRSPAERMVFGQGDRVLTIDVVIVPRAEPGHIGQPLVANARGGAHYFERSQGGFVDERRGRMLLSDEATGLAVEHEFVHVEQTASVWGRGAIDETDWHLLEAHAYARTLETVTELGYDATVVQVLRGKVLDYANEWRRRQRFR